MLSRNNIQRHTKMDRQKQGQRKRNRNISFTVELAPSKCLIVVYLLLHVNSVLHQFLYAREMPLTRGHFLQSTETNTDEQTNEYAEICGQTHRHISGIITKIKTKSYIHITSETLNNVHLILRMTGHSMS